MDASEGVSTVGIPTDVFELELTGEQRQIIPRISEKCGCSTAAAVWALSRLTELLVDAGRPLGSGGRIVSKAYVAFDRLLEALRATTAEGKRLRTALALLGTVPSGWSRLRALGLAQRLTGRVHVGAKQQERSVACTVEFVRMLQLLDGRFTHLADYGALVWHRRKEVQAAAQRVLRDALVGYRPAMSEEEREAEEVHVLLLPGVALAAPFSPVDDKVARKAARASAGTLNVADLRVTSYELRQRLSNCAQRRSSVFGGLVKRSAVDELVSVVEDLARAGPLGELYRAAFGALVTTPDGARLLAAVKLSKHLRQRVAAGVNSKAGFVAAVELCQHIVGAAGHGSLMRLLGVKEAHAAEIQHILDAHVCAVDDGGGGLQGEPSSASTVRTAIGEALAVETPRGASLHDVAAQVALPGLNASLHPHGAAAVAAAAAPRSLDAVGATRSVTTEPVAHGARAPDAAEHDDGAGAAGAADAVGRSASRAATTGDEPIFAYRPVMQAAVSLPVLQFPLVIWVDSQYRTKLQTELDEVRRECDEVRLLMLRSLDALMALLRGRHDVLVQHLDQVRVITDSSGILSESMLRRAVAAAGPRKRRSSSADMSAGPIIDAASEESGSEDDGDSDVELGMEAETAIRMDAGGHAQGQERGGAPWPGLQNVWTLLRLEEPAFRRVPLMVYASREVSEEAREVLRRETSFGHRPDSNLRVTSHQQSCVRFAAFRPLEEVAAWCTGADAR